ncbi:MAG: hypothetical protein WCE93_13790 [Nitrososphaeraceae archaeon]
MEIGAMLYSIIDEIGKEKIQSDVTSDIGLSKHYIEMIMDKCEERIEPADDETLGSLCEGLLHFMLTACTLPSTRKVQINNTDIDIIIPSLQTMKNFPNKSLLIQISKEVNGIKQAQINEIARFQPNNKNIWVISKRPLSIGYINYTIKPEANSLPSPERRSYRDIIVDIHKFLEETGDKSLRFIP